MAPTKQKKTQSQDPTTIFLGEMLESSKPRANGVKSVPTMATAKNSSSTGKEKPAKKSPKKLPKNDISSKKKQKCKGDKDNTSPPTTKKKRENKPKTGSAGASCTGTDNDSSDEEDRGHPPREYLPEVSDEIAIK